MSTFDLTMITLSEIFGDFGFKGVARTPSPQFWAQGIIGYIGVIYYLIKSLRVANVSYVNGMWDGISGIVETIAGYVIWGERLNTWWQYLGIILICAGLTLLKRGGIAK